MGVIQRQAIKNFIVSYLGVLIGAISVLFIYSREDATATYGFAQFLTAMASLFLPFAGFGTTLIAVKYFPVFKSDDKGDNGFLSFLVLFFCFTFLVFFSVFTIFQDVIFSFLENYKVDRNGILSENKNIVFLILFFNGLIIIFSNYCSNYMRIVVPEIIHNLGYKIWLPVLILCFVFGVVPLEYVGQSVLLFHIIALVLLVGYTNHIGALSFRLPNLTLLKSLRKEMSQFALYSGFNSIGNSLAFRIDSIMIAMMLGFKECGIYLLILFMAVVIEKPTSSIIKIASPIISKAWNENNTIEIDSIYKKSSLNLLIIGIPIFLLIWFSLIDIDAISAGRKNFYEGRYVFLLLGMAKLVDMATSVNSQIIYYSKKYKYGLLFILFMGVLNIILNYNFISEYGLVGAAMASFLAMLVFNLIKLIFIKVSFDLQPFTINILKLFLLGFMLYVTLYLLPDFSNPIINMIKNGLIICVLYFPAIFIVKISPDINNILGRVIKNKSL